MQGLTVAECALPSLRVEHLVRVGIVDHAEFRGVVDDEGDGDAAEVVVLDEVRRAVDGVDDEELPRGRERLRGSLLADEMRVGHDFQDAGGLYRALEFNAGGFLRLGLLFGLVLLFLGLRLFLLFGLGCLVASLFVNGVVIAALLGVAGFSSLWSIIELFKQRERVRKGWFPRNPKRDGDKV